MIEPIAHNNSGRTLIVGLGKTGLSCARYLVSQGIQVAITDSREHPPGLEELRAELPDVALFLGKFDDDVFASAGRIVVSPGVPVSTQQIQLAKQQGIPVIGDVELFAREVTAPVAAITGSNGKSTVTTLLGLMARLSGRKVAVGGNIGEPALNLLADDVELYILELSSFQLETTDSLRPRVAAVLNISPDHMDRYHNLAAYAAAKERVFTGADIGVCNADDPNVMSMRGARNVWLFTLDAPAGENSFGICEQQGDRWLCQGDKRLMKVNELALPGRHNQANALAALAMGTALGLPLDKMLAALREFRGLPHRTEFVAEIDGVRWYNDSKGTNVGACIAALEGFCRESFGKTVLIAGGECKQADFSQLVPVVADCARAAVLIGRDAPDLQQLLEGVVSVALATDMDDAVRLAAELAQPGDRILLSPACASFDMFVNFEQRGDYFKAAVGRLGK